ncbi:MAG: Gfo/Idh/MocA family oxidoreductase [Firmicutes bacterium]|nr:Gfo/Idh/MocA family oxidoreductase [Bacillota bacterium]
MNIAILGLGAIAKQMAKAIALNPDAVPYAAAARNLSRAQAFAAEFGFQKAYGSYDELLADPAVELVYIAVPHALHAEYAIMCLKAGKHVLLEKPFTATYAQAQQVIDLAREKHLFAGEGMWMKYLPMCDTIKQLCEDGTIGQPVMMHGSIGYCLTQPRLFDPAMAGGALLDVGCYTLALAGLIFGYDTKEITSRAVLTPQGVDATHTYVLTYENGKMASFTNSMVSRGGCTTEIWGTAGCLVIDTTNNLAKVTVLDAAGAPVRTIDRQPWQNSYQYELAAVLTAIGEGRLDTPQCPHSEILSRLLQMDIMRSRWGMKYPFEG